MSLDASVRCPQFATLTAHRLHTCRVLAWFSNAPPFPQMFRRKKWKYLILDEAHMIKNWKSQRWQTLLRFNSKRRLLITGTPLQVGRGGT